MGAPIFQYTDFVKKYNVICLSSNFVLYGDMSNRVMKTLATFSPDMQVYSIDEAFLYLTKEQGYEYAKTMRETVLKWTGIPVSIGLGTTKTLAKIANEHAKKLDAGVFVLNTDEDVNNLLRDQPVTEIWGIGRRYGAFLNKNGILTALDLKNASDVWVKKNMSVVGLRTVWELRGISCIPFDEEDPPKKSICTSRSFGKVVKDIKDLHEAIATYAARAGEKVREQGSLATYMQVFMVHKEVGSDLYQQQQTHVVFPEPTAYTPTIISYAKAAVSSLFRTELSYRKAGVIMCDLVPEACFQPDLFSKGGVSKKKMQLMHLMDEVNERYGHQMLQMAAEGIDKGWKVKQINRTPRYTTCWDELLKVK